MRRTDFFTLIFLLGWAGKTGAQNLPFPENNAVWKEEHTTIAGPLLKHFELCGDTLLNATHYSKVLELEVDNDLNITGQAFVGGLRSQGERVWFLPKDGPAEYLLYDFGLQAGETIQLQLLYSSQPVTRQVDSVATKLIDGAMRKVIYFHPGDPSENPVEWWVEGLGSTYGLLGRATQPGGDLGSTLLCFGHGDEYVNFILIECFLPEPVGCDFANADQTELPGAPLKLTASPNPGSNDLHFYVNQRNALDKNRISIYMANGKLMKTIEHIQSETPLDGSLPAGFYIAVLESQESGRSLAHCTFVVKG